MPEEEPNKKMEELLKAFAQKRREQSGAPMELHPATRAMLQAEVARRFPAREGRKGARVPFLRKFFLATAAATAVLICAVSFYQQQAPPVASREAAKNTSIMLAKMDSMSTAPASADKPVLEERTEPLQPAEMSDLAKNKDLAAADKRPMELPRGAITLSPAASGSGALATGSLSLSPAASPMVTAGVANSVPVATDIQSGATALQAPAPLAMSGQPSAPAAPVTAAAPPADASAAAGAAAPSGGGGGALAASAPQPPGSALADGLAGESGAADRLKSEATPLLANFEMRLDGDRIRLVDADGSTYTGRVEQTEAQQHQRTYGLPKSQAFAKLAPAQQKQQLQQQFKSSGIAAGASNAMQDADSVAQFKKVAQQAGFFFRVTGTNVTLGKPVVIEGNYIAAAPPAARAGYAEKERESPPPAQIQGQAQIGNGPKIDINAVSVLLKTRVQQ